MKWLPWILIAGLAVVAAWGWLRPVSQGSIAVISDTVRDTVPRPLLVRFDHWDSIPVPVPVTVRDTVRDTLFVRIPIERKDYLTDDYHAIVSGYRPRLELMEVFRQTRTVTVTPRPKRWGLGIQAGVGYPAGWYVGLGVSYDLWQW